MTIEVKQMIIKSTVVNRFADQDPSEGSAVDIEQLKEMVMEECKELIAESLSELQER
jgi:hypothetical protein